MGLLRNRTRAERPAKLACPSCGKPNDAPAPGEALRCILCNGMLPVTSSLAGRGIDGLELPAFALPTTPDLAPDAVDDEDSIVADYEISESPLDDYVPFDMDALKIGAPGLPRASSNDA